MSNPCEIVSRTQDERTAAMRARLINATLETILNCGYARTTLVEIASRAGVTRGAVNHHYDSKDDLIVAAVSDMLQKTIGEIRNYAKAAQEGSLTIPEFLDRVWGIFSGPLFMVTLEQITASRHNNILKSQLVVVTREFHNALDKTWRSFFTSKQLADPELETILNATLCLFRGMGVQTVLRDDPAYYQKMLDFWKAMLIERTGITFKTRKMIEMTEVSGGAANRI